MKRFLIFLLLVICIISFTGCNSEAQTDSGIWLTYYELNSMLNGDFESEFETVINNCKKAKIKNLYIHTRAFGDSLYLSDYFPLVENARKYEYDIFSYILKQCKKADLKVHAWINPYRISTSTTNIDSIDPASLVYKWLNDDNSENDSNVSFANGIYLNPASVEVRDLVVDAIRELLAKYEVDGIHFDDYFYPTTDEEFDKYSYEKYIKETAEPLSLEDWRRFQVNSLIGSCYTAIKYANEDVIFSISPTASFEQNYKRLYADIREWVKKGYIDEIIPQLYFGFNYPDESFRFENLLKEWKLLVRENPNVKLKIGLACYKAKPTLEADMAEWTTNDDIIARQVQICESDSEINGYVLFSYSSLFGTETEYIRQRENLMEYLNSGENK